MFDNLRQSSSIICRWISRVVYRARVAITDAGACDILFIGSNRRARRISVIAPPSDNRQKAGYRARPRALMEGGDSQWAVTQVKMESPLGSRIQSVDRITPFRLG